MITPDSDWIEKSLYDEYVQRSEDNMENRNIVKKGDVLLASTGEGTLGKCCVYDKDIPAIADGHVTIIRVDKKIIDPYYLTDYLRCGFGEKQIACFYSGSTGLIELTPEQVDMIIIDNAGEKQDINVQKEISKAIRRREKKYITQIEEAKELLEYLKNTAGQQIITGQHTQTIPCEEIAYIRQTTGKEPKLRGFELLAYSPNINYADASPECLKEVEENKGTVETALQWARANRPDKVNDTGTENSTDYATGGILTFSFHWFSPLGGRDKSFYTEHTDFDATKVLQEGTPERAAFYADMDVIADILRRFQDENIPILWRPFHESYGTWFWWGAKGAKVARDLYRLMFDYYTGEKNLHNLLWVWNCDIEEAYPGDEYVDVVSIDVYLPEYQSTDYADAYEKLVAATSRDKVAALAEVGYLPDVELLQKSRIPWAYYMTWSKEFCIGEKYNRVENLKKMYDSEYAVTL